MADSIQAQWTMSVITRQEAGCSKSETNLGYLATLSQNQNIKELFILQNFPSIEYAP